MQFVLLFAGAEDPAKALPKEADDRYYQEAGRWFEEHGKAGRVKGGKELEPSRTAKTVRWRKGELVVSDGPFIEAKEGIGGFAILEVPDWQTAIEMAKEWANIGRGFAPEVQEAHWTVEIRPVPARDQS